MQRHVDDDNHKGNRMRLHCFDTPDRRTVYVNLDEVAAVAPDGLNRTLIYTGASCWPVALPIDDVLALISPPATPDTYEEDLAKSHDDIGEGIRAAVQRMRNRSVADYDARLDEVEWMIACWKTLTPADMLDYLFKRQAELVNWKRKATA